MRYVDDENYSEFQNVQVRDRKGHVVVWRAVLLENGSLKNIEKAPIHVVEVVQMMEVSTLQEV